MGLSVGDGSVLVMRKNFLAARSGARQ